MKEVYFFCRNCLKSYKIDVPEFKLVTTDKLNPKMSIEHTINLSYRCDCDFNAEEIDPRMIDNIIRLNRLGFYTDCCCEGHFGKEKIDNTIELLSIPYIKFLSSNDRYADGIRVLDKQKEKFLKNFLNKNIESPLSWKYDEDSKSILVELNTSKSYDVLSDEAGFEALKNEFLDAIDNLIGKLENLKFCGRI